MKSSVSPAVAVIVILVVIVVVAAIGYFVFMKKPAAGPDDSKMVDFSEGTDMMKGDPGAKGGDPGMVDMSKAGAPQ